MIADLRTATPDDIVRRLTDTPYATTAETALAGGLGAAQHGITAAVNEAISAGLIRVVDTRDTTYGRNVRFLALVTIAPHPLVVKAAQRWIGQAARHNVPITIEPMEALESGFGAGGIHVRIDTGWNMECASVAIYPPTGKGRRAAQSAIYLTYHMFNGKQRFGRKPRITLHAMMNNIQMWRRESGATA